MLVTLKGSDGVNNFSGDVSISLYRGTELVSEIVSRTSNPGSFQNWNIPSSLITADNYKIKISSSALPALYTFSDSTFTISGGGVVTGNDKEFSTPLLTPLPRTSPILLILRQK